MGDPVNTFTFGVVGLYKEARDERKEAERKADQANARAEQARSAKAARERRQMARNAIMARSQAQMAGVSSGAGGGSSNIVGSMGAVTTMAAEGQAFNYGMTLASNEISSLQHQAGKHSARSQRYQGYANQALDLGMQAAKAGMGGG